MVRGGGMMSRYFLSSLTKEEEDRIKQILDDLALGYNLKSDRKEVYERDKSLCLDRLWYVKIGEEKVPVVVFEIEKNVPTNERIRKDILNMVMSKAPIGYLILSHKRIMKAFNPAMKQPWIDWYFRHFNRVFNNYYRPFTEFVDIRLVDADDILQNQRLKPIESQE